MDACVDIPSSKELMLVQSGVGKRGSSVMNKIAGQGIRLIPLQPSSIESLCTRLNPGIIAKARIKENTKEGTVGISINNFFGI